MATDPWRILGLDASWAHQSAAAVANDPTRAALLRRAYRRALLQHHPDKRQTTTTTTATVTVDQIKAAYAALGGDRASSSSTKTTTAALASSAAFAHTDAHTGLETVDLDELAFDADNQAWYRGCRCGNARGFELGEADLEEELDAEALALLVDGEGEEEAKGDGHQKGEIRPAAGELLVECVDCSLWLCVHFAVAADYSDDEDADDG